MVIAERKKTPQLRFSEFTKPAELKEIGEGVKLQSGYAFSSGLFSESGIKLVIPKNFTKIGSANFTQDNTKFSKEEVSKKFICSPGDLLVLLTDLTPSCELLGKPMLLKDTDGQALLNQRIVRLEVDESIFYKSFLHQYFLTEKWQKHIKNTATGTTVRHSSNNTIRATLLEVPAVKEQQKIAAFLSSVDDKLNKLRRKRELLETFKRGLMQKTFKQEHRFTQDDGTAFPDWEDKKLGQLANVKRGASPRPISSSKWFSDDSTIGWVRISDVTKSNKYLYATEQYLSDAGIEKSRFISSGNMIMSICATIGKPIITKIDTCIHDGFIVFDELKADQIFFFYLLEMIEAGWIKYGQPGIQLNLNSDIVSGEPVALPCKEEQQKIANFLSSIDKKINTVSQQITQTETFKKGLLQKLFV